MLNNSDRTSKKL